MKCSQKSTLILGLVSGLVLLVTNATHAAGLDRIMGKDRVRDPKFNHISERIGHLPHLDIGTIKIVDVDAIEVTGLRVARKLSPEVDFSARIVAEPEGRTAYIEIPILKNGNFDFVAFQKTALEAEKMAKSLITELSRAGFQAANRGSDASRLGGVSGLVMLITVSISKQQELGEIASIISD